MILKLFVFLFLLLPFNANAQDDVLSLPEIVNPSQSRNTGPVTSLTMANDYYKVCVKEESLVYEDEEKELLCACKSANMSEHLTVEEFRNLDSKGVNGREARGKAIAFGVTPCIEFVLDSKVERDCMNSNRLKDMIFGKRKVCGCATNHFKNVITETGTYHIMEAVKYDPMTLNPMEHYFVQPAYFNQLDALIQRCRTNIQFKKDHQ